VLGERGIGLQPQLSLLTALQRTRSVPRLARLAPTAPILVRVLRPVLYDTWIKGQQRRSLGLVALVRLALRLGGWHSNSFS